MDRFGEEEIKIVEQVIRSGELSRFFISWKGGRFIQAFEQDFANYIGTKYAVSCANGTVSLEVSLAAMGIKRGDEVITTPLSFFATGSAILRVGAKPVFVDIQKDTLNIDPYCIEQAVTRKTKAILPVSLNGYPADMHKIMHIADQHNLLVLEDAAQSLGAEINGQKTGSFAHTSSFSFQESKTITSLDWHEPVLLLSPFNELTILHIGDFVENYCWTGWKCVAFDKELKISFVPITGVYRHPVDEDLYELTLENGRKTTVTRSHSIFIIEEANITSKSVSELKNGDFCCVPLVVPRLSEKSEINLLTAFLALPSEDTANLFYRGQKLLSRKGCWKTKKPSYRLNGLRDGLPIIPSADAEIGNKSFKIKAILEVTPELCRLLGYYLAEGNWSGPTAILTFGSNKKEKDLALDAQRCARTLGFKARIYYESTKTSVHFGQRYLKLIFEKIFETGITAHNKRIPSFLFRVSPDLKKEFIRAYFKGDGYLQKRSGSNITWFVSTVSKKIAEQLPYLLLSMGVLPSIEYYSARSRAFNIIGRKSYISKCSPSYKIGVRGIAQVNKLHQMNFREFSSKPQLVECIPVNHAGLRQRVRNNYSTRKNGFRTVYEKERITRRTLEKMRVILPTDPWLAKLQESEIGFAKIKKIQKVKPSSNYVYDLCVEGYENFVGGIGGVCLHNTLGEGGMITTDDPQFYERALNIRNHGNVYGTMTDVVCTNARMSEAAAAFGLMQLRKLDDFNRIQIENAEYFLKQLKPPFKPVYEYPLPKGIKPSYYLMPVTPLPVETVVRDVFLQYCKEKGLSKGLPGQNIGYYKKLIYESQIMRKRGLIGAGHAACLNAEWARDNVYLFDIHRWNKTKEDMKAALALLQT